MLSVMTTTSRSDVIVQLFQWRFADIAIECCQHLGPRGFAAVQLSPVTEQRQGNAWYFAYQPVSYAVGNRLGDEAAFISMCAECARCGVDVLVDAVVNHMAEGSGSGTAGTTFGSRTFESLYQPLDFHHAISDSSTNCQVDDYSSTLNVQQCDLLGLPDLRTEDAGVRTKISDFLRHLHSLGVSGVRVDAAKHMPAADVGTLLSGTFSYDNVVQEVIEDASAPAALNPTAYVANGRVTEFSYAWIVAQHFTASTLTQLLTLTGPPSGTFGRLPSAQAVVFIDNHDTQRHDDDRLTHEDGELYLAANAFMLAWPYGRPRVMSSYNLSLDSLSGVLAGPPFATAVHDPASPGVVNCGAGMAWLCEHRSPMVTNMVAWRASAGDAPIEHWQTGSSAGQVAFSRNASAFIAFSMPPGSRWAATLQTGLPPGIYCQIAVDGCTVYVTVAADGTAVIDVGADGVSVLALHVLAFAPPPLSPSLPPVLPALAPPLTEGSSSGADIGMIIGLIAGGLVLLGVAAALLFRMRVKACGRLAKVEPAPAWPDAEPS